MTLIVCPAAHRAAICRERNPSHVLTMASPRAEEGAETLPPDVLRLALTFHDISEPLLKPSASFETRPAAAPQDDDRWSQPNFPLRHAEEAQSPVSRHAPDLRSLVPPDRAVIDAILAFGRTWDGTRPMLVSCSLGVSRSTAAALILACQREPDISERDIAQALRRASAIATPNPLMIALADAALGRQGRMIAAVGAIGRGADYAPYVSFDLPPLALA